MVSKYMLYWIRVRCYLKVVRRLKQALPKTVSMPPTTLLWYESI